MYIVVTGAAGFIGSNIVRGLNAKVNVIPLNEFPGSAYRRPSDARVDRFAALVSRAGVLATVRRSRGDDDADPTLSNQRLFSTFTPGVYTFTEAALAGWDLTSLVINDPDNGSSFNLATRTATIDVDAGENITVTFMNTQRGTIRSYVLGNVQRCTTRTQSQVSVSARFTLP